MFGSIGLGTFPFAGPFTAMRDETIRSVLDSYFAAGGTYIDVAPTYAFGEVERKVGSYLKDLPRDSYAVSCSCGYVREGDRFRISGKRDDVIGDAEESLKRLGLDYFDIYISHIPDLETPFKETASALQELLEDGRANQIGVSNVDGQQLREYASYGDITVVQNRFSYLNRSITPDMLSALSDVGAQMVAYQVIERGLLTERGPRMESESDLRRRKPEFAPERLAWVRNLVSGPLQEVATSVGASVEEVVVRWTVSHPGVGMAQMGSTKPTEAGRLPGFGKPLPREDVARLDEIYETASDDLREQGFSSVRAFLGLEEYDVRSGSASGS